MLIEVIIVLINNRDAVSSEPDGYRIIFKKSYVLSVLNPINPRTNRFDKG